MDRSKYKIGNKKNMRKIKAKFYYDRILKGYFFFKTQDNIN